MLILTIFFSYQHIFAQEKKEPFSLEKFVRDSREIVEKTRETYDSRDPGIREINTKKEPIKTESTVLIDYCKSVIEFDKARKEIIKTLGYDPDRLTGDHLKSQDFIAGVCGGIIEVAKKEKEAKENFEKSIDADRERAYKNEWNMEKEANKIPNKTLLMAIPSSIVHNSSNSGKGIFHFFTLDYSRNEIYIFEGSEVINNGVITSEFDGDLTPVVKASYSNLSLIYKNEFKNYFTTFPSKTNMDGMLTVSLKQGHYLLVAFNRSYNRISETALDVTGTEELNYLIHIERPESIQIPIINEGDYQNNKSEFQNLISEGYTQAKFRSVNDFTGPEALIFSGSPNNLKTYDIVIPDPNYIPTNLTTLFAVYLDGVSAGEKRTILTTGVNLIHGYDIRVVSEPIEAVEVYFREYN